MAAMIRKSLDAPEETRPFEDGMGQLELVNLESGPVGRATFQPLAVVEARQADRQDGQLPSRAPGLLHLGPDESRHGRR